MNDAPTVSSVTAPTVSSVTYLHWLTGLQREQPRQLWQAKSREVAHPANSGCQFTDSLWWCRTDKRQSVMIPHRQPVEMHIQFTHSLWWRRTDNLSLWDAVQTTCRYGNLGMLPHRQTVVMHDIANSQNVCDAATLTTCGKKNINIYEAYSCTMHEVSVQCMVCPMICLPVATCALHKLMTSYCFFQHITHHISTSQRAIHYSMQMSPQQVHNIPTCVQRELQYTMQMSLQPFHKIPACLLQL